MYNSHACCTIQHSTKSIQSTMSACSYQAQLNLRKPRRVIFPLRNSTLEWKCAMEVIASATSNCICSCPGQRKEACFVWQPSPEPLLSAITLCHYFVPVAFETSGVIGPQSRLFLKELGHRIKLITGETRRGQPSFSYNVFRLLFRGRVMQLLCWAASAGLRTWNLV